MRARNAGPRVRRRAQFPRTRIGIVRKILQYAPRVLHFSAFNVQGINCSEMDVVSTN